jgi:predicted phage terminase large subunit-like protein
MAMNPAWAIAQGNLQSFIHKAFEEVRPGVRFDNNWHIGAIAHRLSGLDLGEPSRLLITMPPRSLKSVSTSVAWTAYLLGHNPSLQIMVISYSEKLAVELSTLTRTLMDSKFYRSIFPHTRLVRSTNERLATSEGGGRFATTMAGAATGFGADVIIVDDPHNASEIYYPAARQTVKDIFNGTLLTRLNDRTRGAILVVMQRLHEDDLAGHLLAKHWPHLNLPAIATEDADFEIGHGKIHNVKTGDLLHPSRLPMAVLERAKEDMGTVLFEAQYQQSPTQAGGNIIKEAWLRRYDVLPDRSNGQVTISIDTATKTDAVHDYTACTVWLKVGELHYLLDVRREKVDYPGLQDLVWRLWQLHQPDKILIEDAGSGQILIPECRKRGLPVEGCKPVVAKVTRFAAAEGKFYAGKVLLPNAAPWLGVFLAELLAFPGGKHDDQADSVSQYFGWMLGHGSSGLLRYDFGYGDDGQFDHDAIAERWLDARW